MLKWKKVSKTKGDCREVAKIKGAEYIVKKLPSGKWAAGYRPNIPNTRVIGDDYKNIAEAKEVFEEWERDNANQARK